MTTEMPYSFNAELLEEQIAYGSGRVHVNFNVVGYWSDVVQLRVAREHDWRAAFENREPSNEWTFEVTHSSGGRDPKQVADSCVAERNFAAAVIAACDLADILKARLSELEAAYRQRSAAENAERERAQAERQAKIDADPAIGEPAARAYIDALVATTRQPHGPKQHYLSARHRGEDDSRMEIHATRNWDGKVYLRHNGNAISRKDAIAKVAVLAFAGLRPLVVNKD